MTSDIATYHLPLDTETPDLVVCLLITGQYPRSIYQFFVIEFVCALLSSYRGAVKHRNIVLHHLGNQEPSKGEYRAILVFTIVI
ncbi:hypothetical protein E2C01_100608 [Portunus trituberculatus]|uniref:Uncharacterized protein n=1 Tax=Portunus trituberculatus TaxID=210409 RepID=A0A5B7KE04_PORTR|nr:hypothetical protein [Portunus trituberculatus]